MNIARVLAAGLVTSLGCAALAEPPSPTPPAKADDGALKGPSVRETPKVATLVKRDMSGVFEHLDTRPEQAAVGLLGLSAEERAPADKIFTERFTAVTKVLQEHYESFLKLQGARQAGGSREEMRPLLREMRGYVAPLMEPSLQDKVSAVLPEAKRAEFARLVDEYKRAAAAAEPGGFGAGAGTGGGNGKGRGREKSADGDAKPMDDKPVDSKPAAKGDADGPIPPRVEMNLVLREMGRALKAIVTERKEHLDTLLKTVGATPEQEAQIQAIVRERKPGEDKAGAGLVERTPEERIAVWEKIMAVLTPEQRVKARELRRGA